MPNRHGSKWIRPEKRYALYLRDGWCCVYCGATADEGAVLTLDHVLARELGGGNEARNLVTCCLACNSAKRKLTMRSWYRMLRDRGVDTTTVGRRVRAATRRNWKRYLDEGKRIVALRGEED